MASSVWVVDSSFKRTQVKVTPGKYLREVLEEACQSRKINPESYTLKTQTNKVLDLSQPFRLSGLSAGAKLQLTQASRSPSVVSLALQLPESVGSGRLSDKFPSTTSLWLCLRKFEDGVAGGSTRRLNLTQRGVPSGVAGSGRLLYEQPCINVMGRSLETLQDLQKTLAQIGLNSGTALLRLTFKKTDTPLEEAMEYIQEQLKKASLEDAPSTTASGVHAAPGSQAASAPDAGAENVGTPREGDAGREPNDDVRAKDGPVGSSALAGPMDGVTYYKAPLSSTPAAALQPDDPTAFEPNIDHAKAHQASLGRQGKNTRLLSDKELEEAEQQRRQKLASIKSVKIRIRYPDLFVGELDIDVTTTGANLYEKVSNSLRSSEPFELRFMNNKGQHLPIPNDPTKRLIRDLGLQGSILVTMAWSPEASLTARQGPSLKDNLLAHAKEMDIPPPVQHDAGENTQPTQPAAEDKEKKDGSKGKNLEATIKRLAMFGRK